MSRFLVLILALLFVVLNASAAPEIDINTPGVNAVVARMQARYAKLAAYYASGAVGLNLDGTVALRDEASVPVAARRALVVLVDAENQDRDSLYSEIGNANAHPEWKVEVQVVFARRWLMHAHRGWWVMSDHGWIQK